MLKAWNTITCNYDPSSLHFQRQELESENKKLKHDLAEMRQSLLRDTSANSAAPGSPAYKVLLEQLNASCEELDVRKEEVLILRSQLVSQKEAMHHKVEEGFISLFLWFRARHHPPLVDHMVTVVPWGWIQEDCCHPPAHICVFRLCYSPCLFVCTVSQRVKK